MTLADYAETWLAQRDLKDRTAEHYRLLLDSHILPALGRLPITTISPDDIRCWHTKVAVGRPTLRAHCYGLLRTILSTAVTDGVIAVNPCVIRGAGTTRRVHKIRPATLTQIEAIANAMPEPYRLLITLASWCALRFGKLTELRRKDIDLSDEVIRIERAVVRVGGQVHRHHTQERGRSP